MVIKGRARFAFESSSCLIFSLTADWSFNTPYGHQLLPMRERKHFARSIQKTVNLDACGGLRIEWWGNGKPAARPVPQSLNALLKTMEILSLADRFFPFRYDFVEGKEDDQASNHSLLCSSPLAISLPERTVQRTFIARPLTTYDVQRALRTHNLLVYESVKIDEHTLKQSYSGMYSIFQQIQTGVTVWEALTSADQLEHQNHQFPSSRLIYARWLPHILWKT